jgi:hypothetical protein
MNLQFHVLTALVAFLGTSAAFAQGAVVLNVNSATAGDPTVPVGTPVTHFFSSGIYSCTLVSPVEQPQAIFSDWTAWDTPPDNNLRLTRYLIASPDGTLLASGGRTPIEGPVGAAFATTTNKTLVFTVTNDSVIRFGSSDSVIRDNSGGISLLIAPQSIVGTNAVLSSIQVAANQTVRISWPTETNRLYQVLWSSSLATNSWFSLGDTRLGSGAADAVFDSSTAYGEKRFYRVFVLQW